MSNLRKIVALGCLVFLGSSVRARCSSAGFMPAHCDVTERASVTVPLAGAAAYAMLRLQEALRELEDVQGVYSNAEIPDEVVAQL